MKNTIKTLHCNIYLRIFLVAFLASISLAGCITTAQVDDTQRDHSPDEARLAIATAYAPELDALLPYLENPESVTIHGVTFWTGEMRGEPVILFKTGVSLVNASMNTERLLNNFDVKAIIVSGVAGGLDPDLSIGDVAVPRRWAQYNETIYMREPEDGEYKTHSGEAPDIEPFQFMTTRGVRIASSSDPNPKRQLWFPVDRNLLAIAEHAARKADFVQCDDADNCLPEPPEVIIGGSGVTGSTFMDNAEFRDYLHETFEAEVAEMETAAIAMVAHSHNIPFLAFRSLSDLAGGGSAETNEIQAFQHLAAKNSAALVLAFLDAYSLPGLASLNGSEDQFQCDVSFGAMSLLSRPVIAADVYSKLQKIDENVGEHEALSRSFLGFSEELTRTVADTLGENIDFETHNVWGGYLGVTSPSLVVQFSTDGDDPVQTAKQIGSALGYVFMQQSVLVHCDAELIDDGLAPTVHMGEMPGSNVLAIENLHNIYRDLIASADGHKVLGYTYYPWEDRLFSIGFLDGGRTEQRAFREIANMYERDNASTDLIVQSSFKSVSLIANRWAEYPDGDGYRATGLPAIFFDELDQYRAQFLERTRLWSQKFAPEEEPVTIVQSNSATIPIISATTRSAE